MKQYFSVSYKSFAEFAVLPKGKAERQFHFAAQTFYSSRQGRAALACVPLGGLLGLALGLAFGPLTAAFCAGFGVLVGSLAFNAQMSHSIDAQLAAERIRVAQKAEGALDPVVNSSDARKLSSIRAARPARRPVRSEATKSRGGFKFKV